MEEKNAEDANSGKEASWKPLCDSTQLDGDKDDEEEEEETMKDETMTMAKEEQHPGGERARGLVKSW